MFVGSGQIGGSVMIKWCKLWRLISLSGRGKKVMQGCIPGPHQPNLRNLTSSSENPNPGIWRNYALSWVISLPSIWATQRMLGLVVLICGSSLWIGFLHLHNVSLLFWLERSTIQNQACGLLQIASLSCIAFCHRGPPCLVARQSSDAPHLNATSLP